MTASQNMSTRPVQGLKRKGPSLVTSRRRRAFTLFELILAIALSITLLALIGTAINLYLLRVDASRSRVEEAQLARSVLSMIASDLRATTIYKPQDTSGVANLVAASAEYDVDSIDSATPGSAGTSGGATSAGSAGSAGSTGGASSGSSSSSNSAPATDLTMPLGLNGTLVEAYIDVERSPSMEELFLTYTGYTNAKSLAATAGPMAAPQRPSDVKTVRYYVRQGRPLEPGSPAITSLAPEQQLELGGLVRQQIDRPARVWAETSGNQAILDSGQALVAPEVVHLEFRYFDGSQILDYWDMTEMGGLPPAIEVRIWLMSTAAQNESAGNPYDLASVTNLAREYRQIVYLPMAAITPAEASSGTAGASTGGSGFGSGSGGSASGSASGSGTSSL
jgi:uncharacterized membrane protein YgcG